MILRQIHPEIQKLIYEYNADHWHGEEVTDERRTQIEQEIEALDIAMEEKADSYVELIGHYDSEIERIKAEKRRLDAWQKSLEGKRNWLDRTLEANLLAADKRKFETDWHKYSFKRSESMIVRAEDALPNKFMLIVPETLKVDNAAVKAALKEGFDKSKDWYGEFESEEVPGAALVVKQNLQVR